MKYNDGSTNPNLRSGERNPVGQHLPEHYPAFFVTFNSSNFNKRRLRGWILTCSPAQSNARQYIKTAFDMKVPSIIILLSLFIFLVPATLHAQSFTISIDSSKKSFDVFGQFNNAELHLPAVKKQPEYPAGKKAWQDFLRTNINLKVPFENRAAPGSYKVMIRFKVDSNGKLNDIGADTNCGYGMESEVIRCIKKSSDWIPAETTSGRKVSFTLRQVVTFKVKQTDIAISFY